MEPSDKRLTRNTLFLYFRTLLLMVIGVFTSRITLQALGIDDYGIVNVVAGFVVMFSLVSSSLTGACQRFITYELGLKNPNLREVFNASLYIHYILALIIIILAETAGIYFVENALNIPPERLSAARWVYQCSVASFVISMINIPYNAIIIAYEKMAVFAYISLLEGVLKLVIVVALLYMSADKLILYAILGLVSSFIIRVVFQIYCRRKFGVMIKIKRGVDHTLFSKIFGFAGWTFLGNSATIFSTQGVNILLNLFCGVAINAARGIAVMVENVITGFVNNFTTALNPQITKSYARGNTPELMRLVIHGARICAYLMFIIACPLIICSDKLLSIWFVKVPDYASVFVKLTLLVAIIQAIANPFLTVMLASGKVKSYQLVVGLITFLNFPLSYVALKFGLSPICIYLITIFIAGINFVIRLIFVNNVAGFPVWTIKWGFWVRLLLLLVGSFALSFLFYSLVQPQNIIKLVIFEILSVVSIGGFITIVGLSGNERNRLLGIVKKRLQVVLK